MIKSNGRVPGISLIIGIGLPVFWAPAARAACEQVGSQVVCTGVDGNGFLTGQGVGLHIVPNAIIRNVYIPQARAGLCPLSFPSIQVGAGSTVRVDSSATIRTLGVCGTGVHAGPGSQVSNAGTISTSDLISYGIFADDGSAVENTGAIVTTAQGSDGIFGGSGTRMIVGATSTITTGGPGSSGIQIGGESVIEHAGSIVTTGISSHGIDSGRDANVTNTGSIVASGIGAFGIRADGGNAVIANSGTIESILASTTSIALPATGIRASGNIVTVTNENAAQVMASHIGVYMSAARGASLTNAGTITAQAAIRRDGTQTGGGGAVVVDGKSTLVATIVNYGAISDLSGRPAIRSLGPRTALTNFGIINGDVVLADSDDSVSLRDNSIIAGVLDAGAGFDTLSLWGSGMIANPILNMDAVSMSTSGTWTLRTEFASATPVKIIAGTLHLDRAAQLAAGIDISSAGSRLSGDGTVDGLVTNAGVIAPGSPGAMGTLTIAQGLVQTDQGAISVRLDPDGAQDRLVLGGTSQFAGTLAVIYPATGTTAFVGRRTYDVLLPLDGTLVSTGTLTLDAPDLAFVHARLIDRAGGGFAVEVVRLTYSSAGRTESQRSLGDLFDRLGGQRPQELDEVYEALEISSADGAAEIFENLAPEGPGSAHNLSLAATGRVAQILLRRNTMDHDHMAWAAYLHQDGQTRSSIASSEYSQRGAVTGVEIPVGSMRLGIAAARIDGDAAFTRTAGATAVGMDFFAATARYDFGGIRFQGAATYGDADVHIARAQILDGTPRRLTAESDGDVWALALEGRVAHHLGGATLQPHAGVIYQQTHLSVLDERETFGIATRPDTEASLRGRLGIAVTGSFGRVQPFLDMTASAEALRTGPRLDAGLIGVTADDFTLRGDRRRRFVLETEAGVAVELTRALSIFLSGQIAANDILAGRSLTAGVSFRW